MFRLSSERTRRHGLSLDILILATLLLLACAPFKAAIFETGSIPEGLDLTQHYSREASIRRAFQSTWLPLWNPYEFSGFPTQADLQAGVFYPPSMALRLVSLPPFLTWTVIFHVWMFGVGGYVLCRTIGVARAPAAIGAIGLMLGGITMPRVYAGHLDVLRTVAWVPLALAAAMRSIDRGSIWPSPPAVLILSLEVLAGFLQLVCYTFGAIALFAVFSALWPRQGRRSWRSAGTLMAHVGLLVALVGGLTAFQLLPTAQLVMAAGRTHGIPLHSALESSLALNELPAIVFSPAADGALPKQSWETSAYVGWLLAALAPVAALAGQRRRAVVFFALVGGVTLALATGGPLYSLHHLAFPMFRIPGRLMCFWALSVAVLGAIALEWLSQRPADRGRPTWRSKASAARGLVVLLVAAGAIAFDVSAYARRFISVQPLHERFRAVAPLTPSPFGRVLSVCEGALHTTELTALGLNSVDGYNSYFLGDYAHLAERVRGEPPAEQRTAFPRMGETGSIADLGALSVLNVTEIVSCKPVDMPGLELIDRRDEFYIYRNHRASGLVAVACAPGRQPQGDLGICNDDVLIKILRADTPTGELRFRVAQRTANLLWLAEPYYPERRAWVDGVETTVEKTHIALSAIHVGAGAHLIEMRFVPTSLYYGSIVSVCVLGLWFGRAARSRSRRGA